MERKMSIKVRKKVNLTKIKLRCVMFPIAVNKDEFNQNGKYITCYGGK